MPLSTIDTSSISGLGYGFKNRIINGGMGISQRGTSFTLSAGVTTYTLDRWYVNTTGGAGVVTQTGSVGSYGMRITGASGVSSGFFGQKIESNNIADCASSTVTYKIRASSSVLTSLAWYARFPTAQDNYAGVTAISNGTITINSTPTDYTFQIALPSGVTNGFELYFTFGAFTSGTLDITGVQLEKGTVATSFDWRPYGTELALCQRYLPVISYAGGANPYFGAGMAFGTTSAYYTVAFPITPRVPPTGLTVSSASHFAGFLASTATSNATGVVFSGANNHSAFVQLTGMSGLVGGNASLIYMNNSAAQLQFTGCEL